MDELERGIIRGVRTVGGLLALWLEDPVTHRLFNVYGDNGPTVRALIACFGPQITSGHALIIDALYGKEIGYRIDDVGVLAEISP